MAIGRQSVCVLEHELGAPSQARRLRFALSAPIVALSVTGAPFRAAIVSGSGPGALIDPIGGRSDRLDFGSGHGNKPIACVQIAADQHLVISVDVSGLICIWSWDDPDRPALVIASSPIADRVKGSGAVLLTAYSPATGILAVAYSAQGLIDCLQLRSMSAAAGSVSYRRLGRITTRTAPIRALTLAERRLGQIGVTVVARSPWQVELYSTEADFLGCFSEHQDGGCAADRNRMTPIPVPNTGSDALLDLVIAPTLSAYRLRAKTRLAVERSQRIPGMGGPNALPIQPLPDVAAHAIDCSKLSPSRLDRGRRLQGSASEIALASPSWKKTTVDAALLPFLSISKAGAVSDVSSSPPGPVVHSETNESGNGHDTRQTGGVPIIARRIAVDVRINLPKADPHDFLNIGHSRGSGW